MLCIGTPGHHPAGMSYRSPRGRGGCIAARPRYPNGNMRAGLVIGQCGIATMMGLDGA
jgi:hypothetical protein